MVTWTEMGGKSQHKEQVANAKEQILKILTSKMRTAEGSMNADGDGDGRQWTNFNAPTENCIASSSWNLHLLE